MIFSPRSAMERIENIVLILFGVNRVNRSGGEAVERAWMGKEKRRERGSNGPYRGALSLCRSCAHILLFHRKRGGGRVDEKTHDYPGCGSTCAGFHGTHGERADPTAGGGEPARAGAERDADPSGGMPGVWPPLPAGIPLGLRSDALLVRALLAPVCLASRAGDTAMLRKGNDNAAAVPEPEF